jgi:WD40 repeat protein
MDPIFIENPSGPYYENKQNDFSDIKASQIKRLKCIVSFPSEHSRTINCICRLENVPFFVTGSEDGCLKIFHLNQFELKLSIKGHQAGIRSI